MPDKSTYNNIPPGFTLRHTLRGHSREIAHIAWSPDGYILASPSFDSTIRLWDAQTGQTLRILRGHSNWVTSVAWSPDGSILASGSGDGTIRLWDAQTGQTLRILTGHSGRVNSVAWSPDGEELASCSDDKTLRLWRPSTRQQEGVFEGHRSSVFCVSFSCDGHLLASKSGDRTVWIWRTDTWEPVTILGEPTSGFSATSLAFHPNAPTLATLGGIDRVIRIWDLDLKTILGASPAISSIHYLNAKVILLGDSGVGKSGLALVLNGQPFIPTESTHGRHIWTFGYQEVQRIGDVHEIRETLLWDLAGQPDYRLIHQLHMNEVTVALIVFDASHEMDLFTGVRYWDRALRLAERSSDNAAHSVKKFLVAARIDRGGRNFSSERIKSLVRDLGFHGYFETSARENLGIVELVEAIRESIDWDILPKVTSTEFFQLVKTFLISEKQEGHFLSTVDDLYYAFLNSKDAPNQIDELRDQFETCLGHVEASGLIRRLSFGNVVLLQPELLDAYASALLIAVKNDLDGLGSIAEAYVWKGQFPIPREERIKDKAQEKLLLISMIEELLSQDIALREQGNIIVPSQSTREHSNLSDPEGKTVSFAFEGAVLNVYTTLVVRLSNSGIFQKKELWKNAITFTTKVGGTYGIFMRILSDESGELTLFFEKATSEEMRFHFEEFIETHLRRHALPESIQRRRIFVCSTCGEPFTETQVKRRREADNDWIRCGVCDTQVSILDREERLTPIRQSVVQEMDRAADIQRDLSSAASKLQGKIATGDFDVFLCHHGVDKTPVKKIGEQLKEQGILPWLDEWELRPGIPWQRLLEERIEQIKSAVVFVGKNGIGPWQQLELESFLREFANRGCPVIPVLLPDAPDEPKLPSFLKGMTWVDFRSQDPDPMERLIWGITGVRERY